jgi:hypothetical protein
MKAINDDPSAPWNHPAHRDDPNAPHNRLERRGDPSAPWNSPAGSERDLRSEEREYYHRW